MKCDIEAPKVLLILGVLALLLLGWVFSQNSTRVWGCFFRFCSWDMMLFLLFVRVGAPVNLR